MLAAPAIFLAVVLLRLTLTYSAIVRPLIVPLLHHKYGGQDIECVINCYLGG
jgi:hypothetical protein